MFVFLLLASCSVCAYAKYNIGPEEIKNKDLEHWARRLMHRHLNNMTAEIVKDAHLKLKHADKIQQEHKGSIGYELGTIAAGILERFLFMLKIYRRLSNMEDIKKKKEPVGQFTDALQAMLGTYNEIIMEKAMFFDTLKRFESIDPDQVEKDRILRLISRKPSVFKNRIFRRSGIWNPAEEQFDIID
ncbi:unnamed protein product [Leptosia nina]|uniref:Uncharacterized protein n=1 Tax=Leptosia nina TaxID=320188 RepID=A0AAV1JYS1_9NEOP